MAAQRPATGKGAGPSKVYMATLGALGRVVRGVEITEAEAVIERQAGRDVVICEGGFKANRGMARRIESQAGPYKEEPEHKYLGPYALPHFQPNPRPPEGHSFFETAKVKAAKNP